MLEEKIRILIVEARFYSDIADALLAGAVDVLTAHGVEHDVVTVPGALEIPAAIAFAEEGGHRPAGAPHYDGYVALGTVIRGETYHFEIVAGESARGLMDLAVAKRLCIGNGILTVEDQAQAWARAKASEGDKGGAAAKAVLSMVETKQRLMVRR
jgi:6,7-dimethyl-8-ribityllumazine synthase